MRWGDQNTRGQGGLTKLRMVENCLRKLASDLERRVYTCMVTCTPKQSLCTPLGKANKNDSRRADVSEKGGSTARRRRRRQDDKRPSLLSSKRKVLNERRAYPHRNLRDIGGLSMRPKPDLTIFTLQSALLRSLHPHHFVQSCTNSFISSHPHTARTQCNNTHLG